MKVRPLVAIPSDLQTINDQRRYTAEVVPIDAIARITGLIPLIVPALADRLDIPALLTRVDGLMMPGGLSNVHPSLYGRPEVPEKAPFDVQRDATDTTLIHEALKRGVPLLMTCRGFQELNVALGGTLKAEPDDLPECEKHGTPESAKTEDERFKIRQRINVVPGGKLAQILQSDQVAVNSLHSQLIDDLAPGLEVEATAEDGTIEAVSVRDAKGFALGVVFHPEYWVECDSPSRAILNAFGEAVHAYAASRPRPE